jgi:hypothetical protein
MKITKQQLKSLIREQVEDETKKTLTEQQYRVKGLAAHLDNARNVVNTIAEELGEGPFLDVNEANEARESYTETLLEVVQVLDSLKDRLGDGPYKGTWSTE